MAWHASVVRGVGSSFFAHSVGLAMVGLAASFAAAADIAPAPSRDAAHWRKGEVRWFNAWVKFDGVPKLADNHVSITAYERIRANYPATVEGQLALAKWCADRGLHDQTRAHLTVVVGLDPDHAVARQALGFVRHGTGWATKQELATEAEQARADDADLQRWAPKTQRWRTAIDGKLPAARDAMLAQIREVRDVSAVLALERGVSTLAGDEPGLAVVAALTAMPDDAATFSLARHAAFHESEVVRRAATVALKERTLETFVPPMLAAMYTPVEMHTQTGVGPGGSLIVTQTFTREAQKEVQEAFVQTTVVLGDDDADTQSRAVEDAETTAETNIQLAQAENDRTALVNSRVSTVLASVTGADLPNDPTMWWQWWNDRNEVYTGDKPTHRRLRYDEHYIEPRFLEFEELDCLAAGTPVWTTHGLKAIETVQVGDVVLSQDVETGELAYKPVLATTIRPISKLTKLTVDEDVIRTSGGHPLWVDGRGWVRARHVAAGEPLHGVDGAKWVTTADKDEAEPTYNLIVADFHTYFIGQSRVLSHDNTAATPTKRTTPGR